MDVSSRILLVEDQFLIAMDAEATLIDYGFNQVRIATTMADARSLIDQFDPQIAILDIDMSGETTFELAKFLQDKGVGVAFASGYSRDASWDSALSNVPIIPKPFSSEDLIGAITQLQAIVQKGLLPPN